MHFLQSALVQQIHNQLHLVHTLEVGDLRLVAGLDQGLETAHDKLGKPATEHGLLAKEVGFRFFPEARGENAGPCTPNPLRVREGPRLRIAGGILGNGNQTGHTTTGLVLAPHEVAWPLGSNQHDVEIGSRLNLTVVDIETVREQQRGALRQIVFYVAVKLSLCHVGYEESNEPRALDCLRRRLHVETVIGCLRGGLAVGPQAYDHVEA